MCDKNGVILERFRDCVVGYTREEIANAIGCDTSMVTKHYNGDRNITIDYAVKYAKFFGVSLDYLVGIRDEPTTDIEIQAICEYTGLHEETVKKYNEIKNKPAYNYLIVLLNDLLKENYIDEISEKLENIYHYYDSFIDLLSVQSERMRVSKNILEVLTFYDEYKQRLDLSDYSKQLTVEIIKKVIDDIFSDFTNEMKKDLKYVSELEKTEDIDNYFKKISSLYSLKIEDNKIIF